MNIVIGLAAIIFAILERFPALRFCAARLLRRYFLSDLFYLITGFLAGGTVVISYFLPISNWLKTELYLPRLTDIDLPLAITSLLAIIVLDLGNYLSHYLLHRFDILWQFHKVHHSIDQLDWLATFRSHIIEQILRRLIAPILLVVIGFPLNAVIIAGSLVTFWGIFNHSNLQLKLAWLESVFITPRLHRLHHAGRTSQKNLGTVFSFWDRWRGSLLIKDLPIDCKFGNGEADYPQGWLKQFIRPLKDLYNQILPSKQITAGN